MRKQIFFAIGLLCFLSSFAQNYSTLAEQQARIQNIVKAYPQLATVSSMIKTNGGKDIWMITIGTGKTETKPAIAVVGGVEGNHLLGAELVIGFAENVLKASGKNYLLFVP
jgi:hypothetical protein